MKYKAVIKTVALSLAFILASVLLFGCKSSITESEAREALPPLIEKANRLNVIYFGTGFPPSGNEAPVNGYYYVNGDAHLLYSISEIKEATEEVYTKEYAEILYSAAFDGAVSEDAMLLPRYMEGDMGLMQSVSSKVYELSDRSFDFDSLEIVGFENNMVRVELMTRDSYGNEQKMEIILAKLIGEDKSVSYRLDSPTY